MRDEQITQKIGLDVTLVTLCDDMRVCGCVVSESANVFFFAVRLGGVRRLRAEVGA